MLCDELCVSAKIQLYRAMPSVSCCIYRPMPTVTTGFYCPENGNFIMSDGSVFYTSEGQIFWVKD